MRLNYKIFSLERNAKSLDVTEGLSVYLDFVRFTCAIIVVVFHGSNPNIAGPYFFPFGLDAVIVFFVLSGFIISWVTETRERNGVEYFSARLARLWSVLIPALLIAPVADFIGSSLYPGTYMVWGTLLEFDHPVFRLLTTSIFLNEIWFWSICPLSAGPAWSLGYEFWYYVIFAAWAFSPPEKRILYTCVAAFIAGPKILLLMPAWLFGVLVQRYGGCVTCKKFIYIILFIFSPLIILIFHKIDITTYLSISNLIPIDGDIIYSYLKFSTNFIYLNLIAIFISINFWAASGLSGELHRILMPVKYMIRWLAGFTLSIYLFHLPMQLMLAAATQAANLHNPFIRFTIVVIGSVAISMALGAIFEPRTTVLRVILRRILGAIFKRPATVA